MAMYCLMLKPDSRSDAFFSAKSWGKFSQNLWKPENWATSAQVDRKPSGVGQGVADGKDRRTG